MLNTLRSPTLHTFISLICLTACSTYPNRPSDQVILNWEAGFCPKNNDPRFPTCNDGLEKHTLFSVSGIKINKQYNYNASTKLNEYPPPTHDDLLILTQSVPHFSPMSTLPQYMMKRDTNNPKSIWYYPMLISWKRKFETSNLYRFLSENRQKNTTTSEIRSYWTSDNNWIPTPVCYSNKEIGPYLARIYFTRGPKKIASSQIHDLNEQSFICEGPFTIL